MFFYEENKFLNLNLKSSIKYYLKMLSRKRGQGCVYAFKQQNSAIQQHKGSLFHYSNCKMTVHTHF